jgi:hypothetical protein
METGREWAYLNYQGLCAYIVGTSLSLSTEVVGLQISKISNSINRRIWRPPILLHCRRELRKAAIFFRRGGPMIKLLSRIFQWERHGEVDIPSYIVR